ncbi:MAG: DUF4214 domain-containing protein [Pyrinomonadaceae bacterium]
MSKSLHTSVKVRSRLGRRVLLSLLVLILLAGLYISSTHLRVVEALSVTTFGVPITQNFNTLPASGSATFTNDSTLPGWYSARTGTGTTIVANDGVSNAGNLYSYGTGANTDRALGSLGSGNAAIGNLFWGILLTNNTGGTMTSLDVSYTGEQWRNSAAAAQTAAFSYITGVGLTGSLADFQAAGTAVTALDFTSPVTGGVASALDGNAAANRTAKSFTITGLSVANGDSILLRWSDPDHTGSDHGLSIDDFSATPQGSGGATPTPTPTPTLNVNDVTQAEGNAGTTVFTFTVSLTSPALSDVFFDIATADGVTNPANAGTDYVAKSELARTITTGNTSTTFTVDVNGDTAQEANETFFANVTNVTGGALAGDLQGLGTITNDDFVLTPIHSIQGSAATSPFPNGTVVSTRGIVTLLKSNGYFLQEPDATADADPNTSEGIFVFTSSAPTVAVGDDVTATGQVQEFGTGGTNTELTTITSTIVNSTGNGLPTPVVLTTTILDPTAFPTQPELEKYEDMRMTGSLTTVAPNDSFFDVYTVLTGVARPLREPGIEISLTVPPDPTSGLPDCCIPRWDENPERLSVDTNGRSGSTGLAITSNVALGTVTGPLDFAFAEYHLIPDTDPVFTNMSAVPVPTPLATEFTVGNLNIENFTGGATQKTKASLAIRNVMRYPDIIGHEEILNLTTLQALATQINSDAVAAGDPNPLYSAQLIAAPAGGTQNVGFLVKTARVQIDSVTQEQGSDTYINPLTSAPENLHDRPPLVLHATIDPSGPNPIPVIVVVNHPRSFIDVDQDPGDGPRVRAKRTAQAEHIALLLNDLQTNNSTTPVIAVGDYNAYQFNDGFTDPIDIMKGVPPPDDQVVVDASPDSVNPDFTNLTDLLPVSERYTFVFEGTPQALDHVLVSRRALLRFTRYAVARMDADFPGTPASAFANNATRPERASDHDGPVAYFDLTLSPTAAGGDVSGFITDENGAPVSGTVVNLVGTQTRKTITDTKGRYYFDNVAANAFYTVTPVRANYTFSPANRSFSQLGSHTDAAFTGIATSGSANPLDAPEYFVRQQYVDILGREPDEGGFNYWSDEILRCGSDVGCVNARRSDVAAAFFVEKEFQHTGSFIYDMYKAALGRKPAFSEYAVDRRQIVGGPNVETQKAAFADSFVLRPAFVQRYQADSTAESFVDALLTTISQSSGVNLASQRDTLITRYQSGAGINQSRSLVMLELADNPALRQAEYNAAFVLTEYFSYLRRDPDQGGYDFWLNVLNNGDAGNYRGMVCSFITSTEYQKRFSSVITHSNGECGK